MKKGFTLIELLAVIVILAIIAIIAVPTISNVVKKAKTKAAEASALNYIDAVEKYMMLHDMNPDKYPYDIKGGTFNVAESTEISLLDIIIPKAKAEDSIPSLNSFINVKGDKPTSGTITTSEKGKVEEANIEIKGYSVACAGDSCEAKGGSEPKVTLSINEVSIDTLASGESITLNVTTNSKKNVIWNSSDNSVATVNSGVVTGVNTGSVTITATIGSVSDSVTVSVKKYEEPVSFATDSWETIVHAVKKNNISKYNIGDIKQIDSGELAGYKLRLVNKETSQDCYNLDYSETACGFVLDFVELVEIKLMNEGIYKNAGSWPATSLRTFLNNEFYNKLPYNLKESIIDTRVITGHGKNSGETNFTSTDKLYLFSCKEVGIMNCEDSANDNTGILEYFVNKTNNDRKKYVITGHGPYYWLLRHPISKYSDDFYTINSGGGASITNPGRYSSGGETYYSPAFRIG